MVFWVRFAWWANREVVPRPRSDVHQHPQNRRQTQLDDQKHAHQALHLHIGTSTASATEKSCTSTRGAAGLNSAEKVKVVSVLGLAERPATHTVRRTVHFAAAGCPYGHTGPSSAVYGIFPGHQHLADVISEGKCSSKFPVVSPQKPNPHTVPG